jgi:hypothetical protein
MDMVVLFGTKTRSSHLIHRLRTETICWMRQTRSLQGATVLLRRHPTDCIIDEMMRPNVIEALRDFLTCQAPDVTVHLIDPLNLSQVEGVMRKLKGASP